MKTHLRTLACLVAAAALWPGCRRGDRPESGDPGTAQPDTRPAGPIAADAQDDLDAPRALPRSYELAGWVKTAPVAVALPQDAGRLVEDGRTRELLSLFTIDRVARCRYERGPLKADVLLISTPAPADAFGIFSLLAPVPLRPARDQSMRATWTAGESTVMAAWQGQTCIDVTVSGPADELASAGPLLDRIVFNLPAADPPLLLQVIPEDRLADTRMWLVRSAHALRLADHRVLRELDAGRMNDQLGLDGKVLLNVAAISVDPGEPPNLIWLAEYADAAAAKAVHERYAKLLEAPSGELDSNTLLGDPRGALVFGSWAADQESVQRLLPRLRQALPE